MSKTLLRQLRVPALVLVAFALGALIFAPGQHRPRGDQSAAEQHVWTCSMHPQVRADRPGACPICGMDLIPLSAARGDLAPNEISLSESARIRAKIQTTPVKRLSAEGVERRLLGRVDYDETRLRTVTSWIDGRIDRLHVQTTGQEVGRGQIIATLYSPEVFAAHQDLLVAAEQVQRMSSASETARAGAQAALTASRDRLRLLGITGSVLDEMEAAKRPSEQVKIRSPFAGTVIERLATQGSYVKTGTGLFQIADLSRLWVQLDAYESDLPLLSVGQQVGLSVEALPGVEFEGRVAFVDPVLDKRTRTTRVRIEVSNPEARLRPGMFAEAVVRSSGESVLPSALVIPETAPLFTGRRSIVYVEKPASDRPTYQARIVKLGTRTGDVYPVIGGLSEGERVVTRGAFTLDADLQIRGGESMMSSVDDSASGPFDQTVELAASDREPVAEIFRAYLSLHEALAGDDLERAHAALTVLLAETKAFAPTGPAVVIEAWTPIARQLVLHSNQMASATSLEDARLPFRDVSQQVATLLRVFGNPTGETLRLAFCPMALAGDGAEWLQRSKTIANPYFGASMDTCGDIHETVDHGSFLSFGEQGPGNDSAFREGHGH